jgi:alpha-D-ribose 1-methylphosphonate 5-triphosphate synthase subunit PhnL
MIRESPLLTVDGLHKSFTIHAHGGTRIDVLQERSLQLFPGECIALVGVSGSGKSTFMRAIYGNYLADAGAIWLQHEGRAMDMISALPVEWRAVRRRTIGYVSQFLRVIPRVPAIEVVAEPLLELGVGPEEARAKAQELFSRLRLPRALWNLSPTTFSGGEKQRINIARTLCVDYPILLLDEPTSALDAGTRRIVVDLLKEKLDSGIAMIGIFHDEEVRRALATRELAFEELR